MTITAEDVRLADRAPQCEKTFRDLQAAQEKHRLEEAVRVNAFHVAHAAREGDLRKTRMEWEKACVAQGKIRQEVSADLQHAVEQASIAVRGHEEILKRRLDEKNEREAEFARRQKESVHGRVIVGMKDNEIVDPLTQPEIEHHEKEIAERREKHREEVLAHKVLEEEERRAKAAVETEVLRLRKAALASEKKPERVGK